MFEAIAKSLFYYLMVFSCFGVFFLIKNKRKKCFFILGPFLFCILWRSFSFVQSSRYYSIIIFFCLFLSTYATVHIVKTIHSAFYKRCVFSFLIITILFLHTYKCFSSFNNTYILDLQDKVKSILKQEPESIIYIYDKEFLRISENKNIANKKLKSTLFERYTDITDLFFENCSYSNNLYYIISNDYLFRSTNHPSPFPNNRSMQYTKIEHHFSNAKHNGFVSIYKHFPYSPSPDIAANDFLENCILKAYIPEYDTFIYQKDNMLLWLIGAEIDRKTEIIFHVVTNRPDLLPANRQESGFENLGFRIEDKSERERIGRYRVFEKALPSSYPITLVRVGFNPNGKALFRDFVLSKVP